MNGVKDFEKKHQKMFYYTISTLNIPNNYKIEVPVHIPFEGSIVEFSHRIINGFNLPLYVIEGNTIIMFIFITKIFIYLIFIELSAELQKFVDKCSTEFYDCQTIDAIESIKNESIEVEDIVKYWEKAFQEVMCQDNKYFYFFILQI